MRGCAAHGFFPLSQGLRTRTRARHIPLRRRGEDQPLGREQPLRRIPLLCSPGLERHLDEALKDRPVDRDDFIIAQGCDHLDPHNVAGHDETADL